MTIPAHRRQRHRHLCSVSPRTYWVFWLVQPFATIEEKACLVSNQGISGNFVPISGELAKTWTLATALSR